MIKEGLLVGAGAALGALARYGLLFVFAPLGNDVGITLIINIIGCFAMGLFAAGPFWGTGFLGGFTTFAAFALATAQSDFPQALALAASTFVASVGAYLLADFLRERWKQSTH
ncbi:CrcB family protein [Corynebacterium lubricantis]|uniref:CrcB family protein n=1 Tax=Corynebacterium lubricantis TaxID=541095 RepID=UPI0003773739|nr:CrcB family protein [Corynebacterium lubricantis]